MRILCVAEKPSIAKAISEALSGGHFRNRPGISKFNRNFDFTYNFANAWGSCDVTVTSVAGHLTQTTFPEPYNQWSYDPAALFRAPIECDVPDTMRQVARNIQKEVIGAHILYIWTDNDREGEYIGYEVVKEARKKNPRIEVKRAIFNNTESSHLKQAASRPVGLDMNAVAAIETRIELDLRMGYAMTRFQDAFKKRFRVEHVLSYGSCQFPTLGFVVDRWYKIKNFIPETFWKIELSIKQKAVNGTHKLNWDRARIFDHAAALVLYERMLHLGAKSEAVVIGKSTKATTNRKPLPLTTVELQKRGVALLGMSSDKVLSIAEKLYQQGFISYPRTETDQFDSSIDLLQLIGKQETSPIVGDYARKLLHEDKFVQPRKGKHNDKAHPPIHPVQVLTPNSDKFTAQEYKVYEFVLRSFLAACSDDAKGDMTTVNIEYGEEKFHTTGLVVTELNYLEVYIYGTWKSTKIPPFELGEVVDVTSCFLKDGQTSPPTHMTEPELIGLMDANGIGTDATIASHIAKIKERQYIYEDKKFLIASDLGRALCKAYESINLDAITKPHLRQKLEIELNRIAKGEVQKQAVLMQMIDNDEKVFTTSKASTQALLLAAARILE